VKQPCNPGAVDDAVSPEPPATGQPDPPEKYSVAIIASSRMRDEFPLAVSAELAKCGVTSRVYKDGEYCPDDADCILLMGSLGSLRKIAKLLAAGASWRPPVFVWVSEPLPPVELTSWAENIGVALSSTSGAKALIHLLTWPVFHLISRFGLGKYSGKSINAGAVRFAIANLAWLRRGCSQGWITGVGASTFQKHLFLRDRGFASTFMPVGQDALFGEDQKIERDIDVLFIGRTNLKSRRDKVQSLAQALQARGASVEIRTKNTYGDQRTALVNRSRIVLHIHKYPWDTPWMRWNLAIANGALVASEPLSVAHPLVPGDHYISAPAGELPDAIMGLLADEPRRLEMVRDCREILEGEMSLNASIVTLLEMIRASARNVVAK